MQDTARNTYYTYPEATQLVDYASLQRRRQKRRLYNINIIKQRLIGLSLTIISVVAFLFTGECSFALPFLIGIALMVEKRIRFIFD